MKPEEAIKRLKFKTVLMEVNHKMSTDVYELCYAMKLAIDALEKQIPKKMESYYYCPNCGKFITTDYCPECGQAIDWSEVEE